MSRPGWLNDNAARDFPLQRDAEFTQNGLPVVLPRDAIVDFGCLFGSLLNYPSDHGLELTGIRLAGDTIIFDFDFTDAVLSFTFPLDDCDEYSTDFVEVFDDSCGGLTVSGYLTVGQLEDLHTLLLAGDIVGVSAPIEPYCLRTAALSSVNSLNFATAPRTLATPSVDCLPDTSESSDSGEQLIVTGRCLQGDIRVVEGFNTAIRQTYLDKSLTISARVGAGAGELCDEIPLTAAESSSEGLLTGGPACNELITSISGVSGPSVLIQQGGGVRVHAQAKCLSSEKTKRSASAGGLPMPYISILKNRNVTSCGGAFGDRQSLRRE